MFSFKLDFNIDLIRCVGMFTSGVYQKGKNNILGTFWDGDKKNLTDFNLVIMNVKFFFSFGKI